MNITRRSNVLTFLVTPAVGFALGSLGIFVHWTLVFLVFPWLLLMHVVTSRIRCPNCQTPVAWRRHTFGKFGFEWWSPYTSRHCQWCGHDLTGGEGKGKE